MEIPENVAAAVEVINNKIYKPPLHNSKSMAPKNKTERETDSEKDYLDVKLNIIPSNSKAYDLETNDYLRMKAEHEELGAEISSLQAEHDARLFIFNEKVRSLSPTLKKIWAGKPELKTLEKMKGQIKRLKSRKGWKGLYLLLSEETKHYQNANSVVADVLREELGLVAQQPAAVASQQSYSFASKYAEAFQNKEK